MSRQELLQFDRSQATAAAVIETPSSASVTQSFITEQLRVEAEQNEEKIKRRLKSTHRPTSRLDPLLSPDLSYLRSAPSLSFPLFQSINTVVY